MNINYNNSEWNRKPVIIGETDIDTSQTVKILIGFHGADSTPENMLIHGNKLEVPNAMLAFPRGPIDAGKGLWSWWRDGPGQVDTVATFLESTGQDIQSARDLADERGFTQYETILWGFSQGAAAALVYALLGSHPVNRVGSICGFLPELPPSSETRENLARIYGVFGENDPVVPDFLAEFALEEMQTKGHDTQIIKSPQGHEVTPENLQQLSAFFSK